MANNISQTDAAALQAYHRDFAPDLYAQLYYGSRSSALFDTMEGVKGEYVMTEFRTIGAKAKRWTSAFAPANIGKYAPRVLKTVKNKKEWTTVPQELEATYLARYRKKGQNASDPLDFPFEGFITDIVTKELIQEKELAMWQAVAATTPADTDTLDMTFDGWLKIVTAALVAGDITVTATGTLTSANILSKIDLLWGAVSPAYKTSADMIICMSFANFEMYRIAYDATNNVNSSMAPLLGTDYEGIPYRLGGSRAHIVPFEGMGTSNRVIVTSVDNFVIGIDAKEDDVWNTDVVKRNIDFWTDFHLGVNFKIVRDGILVVNDQV
jgi:hypothetical protein